MKLDVNDKLGHDTALVQKPRQDHAQESVHGKAAQACDYLALVPTYDWPGFAAISARAVQAFLALLAHACQHGAWMEKALADSNLAFLAQKELSAFWTVGGLAYALGVNRNTAGAALQELVDFGWVRKSQGRHAGGQFGGFMFALRAPTELTGMARSKIHKRLRKKGVEYKGFEEVVSRYLTEHEITLIRNEIDMELADERDGPDSQRARERTVPKRQPLPAINSDAPQGNEK